jgi:hypothetical protein
MKTKIKSIALLACLFAAMAVLLISPTPRNYPPQVASACQIANAPCNLPQGFRGWPSIP